MSLTVKKISQKKKKKKRKEKRKEIKRLKSNTSDDDVFLLLLLILLLPMMLIKLLCNINVADNVVTFQRENIAENALCIWRTLWINFIIKNELENIRETHTK